MKQRLTVTNQNLEEIIGKMPPETTTQAACKWQLQCGCHIVLIKKEKNVCNSSSAAAVIQLAWQMQREKKKQSLRICSSTKQKLKKMMSK